MQVFQIKDGHNKMWKIMFIMPVRFDPVAINNYM